MFKRKSFLELLRFSKRYISDEKVLYCKNVTSLHQHEYISVYGPDTIPFLNGLVTAKLIPTFVRKNLTTISMDEDSTTGKHNPLHDKTLIGRSLYAEDRNMYGNIMGQSTCFLNSLGKLITPSVLYVPLNNTKKYPEVTVELDNGANELIDVMNRHKIMSKIKISRKPIPQTWEIGIVNSNIDQELMECATGNEFYDASLACLERLFNVKNVYAVYMDTQFQMMSDTFSLQPPITSFRVLTLDLNLTTGDILNKNIEYDLQDSPQEDEIYNHFQDLKLKSEIADNIQKEKYLPLDVCYDLVPNAISFDKGCYVGQELTTRMHTTNKISKRIIPVELQLQDTSESLLHAYLRESDRDLDIYTDSPINERSFEGVNPFASTENTASSPLSASKEKTKKKKKKKKKRIGKFMREDALDISSTTKRDGLALLNVEYINEMFVEDSGEEEEAAAPTTETDSDKERSFYIEIPSDVSDDIIRIEVELKPPYWLYNYMSEYS